MYEDSQIASAQSRVSNNLTYGLKLKYGIEGSEVKEKILKLHGMDKKSFDVITNIESLISSNLNDVSADANSNKSETTIAGIMYEASVPFNKNVGYRYLYRKMKELYGKSEAKRLACEMYDFSLGLSDSSKILQPYCWAYDASSIVREGRPFGKLQSKPPKTLHSYIGALNETVHQLSNNMAGAIAVSTLFTDIAYLVLNREKDLNFEPEKYIENTLQSFIHSVNHLSRNASECVTEDTEVLTPQGFKKYNEVNIGDDIYTWKDGNMEIQKVKQMTIKDYAGDLHGYFGRDYSQIVTAKHKILRKIYNSDKYELIDSYDIFSNKTPETFPVAFHKTRDKEYPISDAMIKMLAIVLTEKKKKKVNDIANAIAISKSPKREAGIKILEETLSELNIKPVTIEKDTSFSNDAEQRKYRIRRYDLSTSDSKPIISLLDGKRDDIPEFVFQFSQRQAELFLNTWANFDGHIAVDEYNKTKIQCDNEGIQDKIQHIAMLAGYSSAKTSRIIGINKKATLYVNLYNRKNKTASNKKLVPYKGKVWCPSTDNGIVVYRREGRIFISGNCPFTNVSIFDRGRLHTVISSGIYPEYKDKAIDSKEMQYMIETAYEVQNIFLSLFDLGDPSANGRPYAFPIVTVNLTKDDDGNILDEDFLQNICNREIYRYNIMVSKGTRVSSCCRLSSDAELMKEAGSVNSFGGSALSLGSHRVCTINFARPAYKAKTIDDFYKEISNLTEDCGKILNAHRQLLKDTQKQGLQPFMDIGWVSLKKMFSTVGASGFYEMNEVLNTKFGEGDYTAEALKIVNGMLPELAKEYKCAFNFEQIPSESMAIRFAEADRAIFGEEQVPYTLYANQFIPLWENHATVWERMEITGKYDKLLTGGSIAHFSLGEKVTPQQAEKLIKYACKVGCEFFALNAVYSECEQGHNTFGKHIICPVCQAKVTEYYTRIVGFMTKVSDWTKTRREWEFPRREFKAIE